MTTLPLNYYTTSMMLQQVMEKPLEKKAGKTYGPPGTKKLVYFIDDMNMPEVDTYGTVQPHTLIRQVHINVSRAALIPFVHSPSFSCNAFQYDTVSMHTL